MNIREIESLLYSLQNEQLILRGQMQNNEDNLKKAFEAIHKLPRID